jgi:ankyrin repeat protein
MFTRIRLLMAAAMMLALLAVLGQSPRGDFGGIRLDFSTDPALGAVMTAIEVGNLAALEKCLRVRSLDLNRTDREGHTPLTRASRNRCAEAVRLLLNAGADPNRCDDRTRLTPLRHAVSLYGAQSAELVALLIEHGADANAADERGVTPVMPAAWSGSGDVTRLLIGAGANVNARPNDGFTALHRAATADSAEVVTLLLAAGADPGAVDDRGHTPLDVALEAGSERVASVLRKGYVSAPAPATRARAGH